jgi:hypothetical protein
MSFIRIPRINILQFRESQRIRDRRPWLLIRRLISFLCLPTNPEALGF